MLDLCRVSKCSCLIDVNGVLNRLYKAAATACTTFEWVGGSGPTRHYVTDQRKDTLNECFLGIFCYGRIMIELHFFVFANIHSKLSAVLAL